MWLISDYDGTLRNGKNFTVDSKDLTFVKQYISKGNKFIIATGRAFFMIDEAMQQLELHPDYYITNAGTYIYNQNKEVIYAAHLNQATLTKILDFFKTIDLQNMIYADQDSEYYLFVNDDNLRRSPSGRQILDQDYDSLYGRQIACFKIVDSQPVLNQVIAYFQANLADEVSLVINTDTNLIEIHPASSSKAHAIKILQQQLQIADDEIIVAGDDDNDIQMLDNYKNSFCIRQPYNERIQIHGEYLIDHLWEIEKFLKK